MEQRLDLHIELREGVDHLGERGGIGQGVVESGVGTHPISNRGVRNLHIRTPPSRVRRRVQGSQRRLEPVCDIHSLNRCPPPTLIMQRIAVSLMSCPTVQEAGPIMAPNASTAAQRPIRGAWRI